MDTQRLDEVLAGARGLRVTLSDGSTLTIHRSDLASQGAFERSVWVQLGVRVREDHEAIARALTALVSDLTPVA